MTKLEDIEQAVEQLSTDELAKFRTWFAEFQARQFDEQIERDVAAGRLDWLVEEAIEEHRAGKTLPLP